MKDILNNLSLLEGFMSNEDLKKGVSFAESSKMGPCLCSEYGGPDDPGEPGEPGDPWDELKRECR